jgi:ribonuclease E
METPIAAEASHIAADTTRQEAGAETTHQERPAGEEAGERRERRSRDRYGRDRRERGERGERTPREGEASMESTVASVSEPAVAAPAKTTSASAERSAMPRIGQYTLPVAELDSLAQASQLSWVQSNPARVAEVQAAIAAEPRPVHVPRERPPLVVLDEGPLILVETRRDLQQLAMPFEATTSH